MKNTVKLAAIGALMVAGLVQSQAQTSNVTFNVSQALTVALTGWAQTGGGSNSTSVTSVHIGTKDVIGALAAATGTSFSPKAKLLILSASDGSSTSIIVRDVAGKTNVDTDVSAFLARTTSVTAEKAVTSASGKTTGTMYSIDTFTFGGGTNAATSLSFTVQAYTTTSLNSGAFSSAVNGSGTTTAGDTAVLKGNINASATKKEKS